MPLLLGILLTALAGWLDALGFLQLAGYYTSFMSGNTTQLGIALVGGMAEGPALPALLVLLFFGGAFAGSLIAVLARHWCLPAVLGAVALLLWTSAAMLLSREDQAATMLLAAAMGLQNAAPLQIGSARPGVTYVTGTLFNAGRGLAMAVLRLAPHREWMLHAVIWLALMAGASCGALAYARFGLQAIMAPAAAAAVLALICTAVLVKARLALRR